MLSFSYLFIKYYYLLRTIACTSELGSANRVCKCAHISSFCCTQLTSNDTAAFQHSWKNSCRHSAGMVSAAYEFRNRGHSCK